VAGVEECLTVPQLRLAVTARSRPASPVGQEINIALSGEVEAVAIAADERAGRSG